MNPLLLIAVFVVLLGILIFFMQRREPESEILPIAENDSIKEKRIVKVNDYQAQYEKEKQEETPPPETPDEASIDELDKLEGIGQEYKELLRVAGYTKLEDFADSNPEELYSKIVEINEEKGITVKTPSLEEVEEWIKSVTHRD